VLGRFAFFVLPYAENFPSQHPPELTGIGAQGMAFPAAETKEEFLDGNFFVAQQV
jgi:hypothetical protein